MTWRRLLLLQILIVASACRTEDWYNWKPPPEPAEEHVLGQPPPREIRVFSREPLPEAARLQQRLFEGADDLSARQQLPPAYQRAGYASLAALYRRSLGADSEERSLHFPLWGEGPRPGGLDVSSITRKINALRRDDDYEGAIELAEAELRDGGESIELSLEWATAVLGQAAFGQQSTLDLDRLELAIRCYVTVVAETRSTTPSLAGQSRALAYEYLALVLQTLGDFRTALAAAERAMAEAEREQIPSGRARAIAKRVRKLERQVARVAQRP